LPSRIQAELTAARDVVAAMPAGAGFMLGTLVDDIAARARTVRRNAEEEGGEDADDLTVDEAGATGYVG
jgi:hypothetical protein